MSEQATDPVKTVCCANCHEWYDARAPACYLCGEERPDYNAALANAVHAERLNSGLARQAGVAAREARVSAMIPSGGLAGRAGPSRPYPGSEGLVKSIRAKLFNE